MAQEENQRCSNSSSGGGVGGGGGGGSRSSKKQKQKKIPQRGLGVAQLEKIRLEEQQKKEAGAASPFVFLPLPQQPSSIPFPPPSPTELPTFRPNFDLLSPPPPPPSSQLPSNTTLYGGHPSSGGGGSSIGGVAGNVPRHGYLPSMWNPSEYNGEGSKLDPGFAFHPHLLSDFNSISPPSLLMHRKQQQQQNHLQQHLSKVNASNSLSSGFNLQMEPPSNQSCYSNYTLPMWPEEEKMVGMKRPWPFSLDNPPGPSLHCNFPQFVPPISRLDESSSSGNGSTLKFEPGNAVFSDGPSGSASHHFDWRGALPEMNPKKVTKENGPLDTLLTLGPATTSLLSTKAKQPLEFPASRDPEFSEFNSMLPYQGYKEDPMFGAGRAVQSQSFYSFLPPKGQQVEHTADNSNDQRSEISDSVDLNLKL